MSTGTELIAAERKRQILVEGYDDNHDRGHAQQLVCAAECYAENTAQILAGGVNIIPGDEWIETPDFQEFPWPWAPEYWKPTGDPIRDLVKAGALIAAAIDSLESQVVSR